MDPHDPGSGRRRQGEPLRTIFCGTPEFAVPTLEALIGSPYSPVWVITPPDRPRGRGQRLSLSPVKEVAVEAGIPVHQPRRFNTEENLAVLRETKADLAVVVAYSAKIGAKALDLMPQGWLNLHPSLLPSYRGAAPLQWALINGEEETGLTTFFLNEEWDAGPICLQEKTAIGADETYGDLAARVAVQGADLVLRSIRLIESGESTPIPQNDDRATFAPSLTPEDSILNWGRSAIDIHNRVRGLIPHPGSFARMGNRRIQILETCVICSEDTERGAKPGQVVRADKGGIEVATGRGILDLRRLRPQNRASMSGKDFVNGYRVRVGDFFE